MSRVKPGFYRHYKGKLYCVHDFVIATHTETKEKFVIFSDGKRKVWLQPLDMFIQKIKIKGKMITRFEREEPDDDEVEKCCIGHGGRNRAIGQRK